MVQPQPATKAPRSCLLTSTHSGMGRRMGGVNGKAMEEIIITVIIIYTKQVMHNAIAHHPTDQCPASPQEAATSPSPQQTPSTLYVQYDVIWYGIAWPVWVSCPCCIPSQLLMHPPSLLTGRAVRENKKSLTYCKHHLTHWCFSCCYQHYSYPKSETQHCTIY